MFIYSANRNNVTTKRKKLDAFPIILHRILSDSRFTDTISWSSHGCAWRVHNRDKFLSEVIPKFFHHNHFKSFQRQVKIWGFIRITKGKDKGCYYHNVSYSYVIIVPMNNFSKLFVVIFARKSRTSYSF